MNGFRFKRVTPALVLAAVALLVALGSTSFAAGTRTSRAAIPYRWQRCSHVNARYRHGVGRANAHDHTRSGLDPVTNFYRSTRIYNIAMHYNKRLDADKDGIACEKH